MKTLFFILSFLFNSIIILSQAPQAFNFQMLVRDADNQLLTSQKITIQITLIESSVNGKNIYQEIHQPISDNKGWVNISIGKGNVILGDFEQIDWSKNHYFLKTETDPHGGTNYLYAQTQELFSVPYSLYSENTGEKGLTGNEGTYIQSINTKQDSFKLILSNKKELSIENTNGGSGAYAEKINAVDDSIFVQLSHQDKIYAGKEEKYKHFIGEQYGGGIIYYLYKDENDEEHGLITSLIDLHAPWVQYGINPIASGAVSSFDGKANTAAIISLDQNDTNAAWVCTHYNGGGFNDWYLPAWDELELLKNKFYELNIALSTISNSDEITTGYWTSTEVSSYINTAYSYVIINGLNQKDLKVKGNRVRPIRSF